MRLRQHKKRGCTGWGHGVLDLCWVFAWVFYGLQDHASHRSQQVLLESIEAIFGVGGHPVVVMGFLLTRRHAPVTCNRHDACWDRHHMVSLRDKTR